MTETICQEADRIVSDERMSAYGHPKVNFDRIARVWSVVLGVTVTAQQVGLCLIGLKLARGAHSVSRDTLVDIAGYAKATSLLDEP